MTPKKCAGDFGIQVTKAIKESGYPLKVNVQYFKKKKKTVDDIDVNYLQQPIRSSTPTPSETDCSTIMAGHLDYTIDEEYERSVQPSTDINETENESQDSLECYLLDLNAKSTSRGVEKKKKHTFEDKTQSKSNGYCQDWMQKEQGVSTTNSDAPPSIYEPSLILSKSLLDVTSISRNEPTNTAKSDPSKNTGRPVNNYDSYSNTVFM